MDSGGSERATVPKRAGEELREVLQLAGQVDIEVEVVEYRKEVQDP